MGFAGKVGAAYAGFSDILARVHYGSGGLSTRLLPRALAFGAGLVTGAITIDSLVDLLTGEHDWIAGAEHGQYETNSDYQRVSEELINSCEHEYSYSRVDRNTGQRYGEVMRVIHNTCKSPPQTNSTGDNAWQRATIAAGLVLAGLGAYGAYRWHKWTQRGLRTTQRQKVGEVEVPTYDTLEPAILGLRNSAEAGMNPEEVTALRRRLGDALDATYAARGGFDTHQTLREQLGQIGKQEYIGKP